MTLLADKCVFHVLFVNFTETSSGQNTKVEKQNKLDLRLSYLFSLYF